MPMFLEPRDVIADLVDFKSILIVPCPICPPMSLAMQKKKPFIELLKHGLKTEAFEDYLRSIRDPLEQRGIRTDVFTLRLPSPLMCLWTEGQRDRLRRRAKDYDAVLVLGCNSATSTVRQTLEEMDCQVIQAMRMRGIANATTKFQFPLTVKLDKNSSRNESKVHRQKDSRGAARENEEEVS